MPLRKIDEPKQPKSWSRTEGAACRHPEHNPPSMYVYEPGLYEYQCPGCGRVMRFRVNSRFSLSLS